MDLFFDVLWVFGKTLIPNSTPLRCRMQGVQTQQRGHSETETKPRLRPRPTTPNKIAHSSASSSYKGGDFFSFLFGKVEPADREYIFIYLFISFSLAFSWLHFSRKLRLAHFTENFQMVMLMLASASGRSTSAAWA